MKLLFRLIALVPWPLAFVLPGIMNRAANYQGFEGVWLGILPLLAYHLSAIILLVGCVQAIFEAHRNQSALATLLFTAIGGSFFLSAYLLNPPDTANWSGGNLMKLYSMLPGTLASLGEFALLLFLARRWRPHLGLLLIMVHAAISLFISLSYLGGFLSKVVSRSYTPWDTGVPKLLVRLHPSLSFVGSLCAIFGVLSLFLFFHDAQREQPKA